MKNLFEKTAAVLKYAKSRVFAVGLLSAALAFTVYAVSMQVHAVYIRDGEDVTLKFTMEKEPDDILQENGIATIAADVVDFSGFTNRTAHLNIQRAFEVPIVVDGQTLRVLTTDATPAQVLANEGIPLGPDDITNIPLDRTITSGETLVIQRVAYQTLTQTESIPHTTVEEKTSAMISGVRRQEQKGQDGTLEKTYRQTIVDGQVTDTQLVGEQVLSQPVNGRVSVGTHSTVSKLDFGVELSGNAPANYSRVITGAKATGYSARPGARTASGRAAKVGHVAVDPAVIPYGTKLYITSADGRFVYGFAIAADTGTALRYGDVDVDLFYDTYEQSCQNGVKWVNIYVLS